MLVFYRRKAEDDPSIHLCGSDAYRVERKPTYLADRFSPSPIDSSSMRIVFINDRLFSLTYTSTLWSEIAKQGSETRRKNPVQFFFSLKSVIPTESRSIILSEWDEYMLFGSQLSEEFHFFSIDIEDTFRTLASVDFQGRLEVSEQILNWCLIDFCRRGTGKIQMNLRIRGTEWAILMNLEHRQISFDSHVVEVDQSYNET